MACLKHYFKKFKIQEARRKLPADGFSGEFP